MRLALAADHAGFAHKTALIALLQTLGHEVVDFGATSEASCDYADFAVPAAQAVAKGECTRGIVLCGSGIGVCLAANKVPGIRCALVYNDEVARLAWQHNHAQLIALGARFFTVPQCLAMTTAWLDATFEERHQRRIDKIHRTESPTC